MPVHLSEALCAECVFPLISSQPELVSQGYRPLVFLLLPHHEGDCSTADEEQNPTATQHSQPFHTAAAAVQHSYPTADYNPHSPEHGERGLMWLHAYLYMLLGFNGTVMYTRARRGAREVTS